MMNCAVDNFLLNLGVLGDLYTDDGDISQNECFKGMLRDYGTKHAKRSSNGLMMEFDLARGVEVHVSFRGLLMDLCLVRASDLRKRMRSDVIPQMNFYIEATNNLCGGWYAAKGCESKEPPTGVMEVTAIQERKAFTYVMGLTEVLPMLGASAFSLRIGGAMCFDTGTELDLDGKYRVWSINITVGWEITEYEDNEQH